jgi:ribonuclease PH
MRSPIIRVALVAGATLALAACGGGDGAANNVANEADNSALEPLNDQSATESVGNAVEPIAPANETVDTTAEEDPGADDGGETIETNTPGI